MLYGVTLPVELEFSDVYSMQHFIECVVQQKSLIRSQLDG